VAEGRVWMYTAAEVTLGFRPEVSPVNAFPCSRWCLMVFTGGVLASGCGSPPPASSGYLPVAIDTEGGSGADGVVVADVDGDGILDAVSAWEHSGRVRLHLQRPVGRWNNRTIAEGADVAGVEGVAVGDLDTDGQMDVVAACESGRLTWIRQGASWTSVVIDASVSTGCGSWIDVEIGDINGDGLPDLVAACKVGDAVSIFYALDTPTGGDSFARFDVDAVTRRKASCVLLVDMDEDGDLDIVSAAREESVASIAWYENPGPSLAFTSVWNKHPIGHWPDAFWLDVGDIDGDGRVDVAASSWEQASFAWFRRPADPREAWQRFSVGEFSGTRGAGITITDLDADGITDLVVGTYRSGRLAVFRPVASVTGAWWSATLAAPGGRLDLVPVVDIDGNGRLDILTTVDAEDGGVFWYRPWP